MTVRVQELFPPDQISKVLSLLKKVNTVDLRQGMTDSIDMHVVSFYKGNYRIPDWKS